MRLRKIAGVIGLAALVMMVTSTLALLLGSVWAVPTVPNCFGVEMHPGQPCFSDFNSITGQPTHMETYAERLLNEQKTRLFGIWLFAAVFTTLLGFILWKATSVLHKILGIVPSRDESVLVFSAHLEFYKQHPCNDSGCREGTVYCSHGSAGDEGLHIVEDGDKLRACRGCRTCRTCSGTRLMPEPIPLHQQIPCTNKRCTGGVVICRHRNEGIAGPHIIEENGVSTACLGNDICLTCHGNEYVRGEPSKS